MFFGKLVRNILLMSLVFIVAINMYKWVTNIQVFGNANNYRYFGFYEFAVKMQEFPNFYFFRQSFEELKGFVYEMSLIEELLGIITLGVSIIAELLIYLVKMAGCFLADVFIILEWLLTFFVI